MADRSDFSVYEKYFKHEGRGHPMTCLWKHRGKAEAWLQPIGNLALEGGGWSAPCSDPFAPKKDPLPIVQEATWALGLVWTAQKNLVTTRIRSLDYLAQIELLYW